jgi:hypothetical protein
MKIDPKMMDFLKHEETQKLLYKVAAQVLPEIITGSPNFVKGGVKRAKNTVNTGVGKVNNMYYSLNHERIFYKKVKEKVLPFPSKYRREELKQFINQSTQYIKLQSNTNEAKKKVEECLLTHELLEELFINTDYQEYLKLYIGNSNSNYFDGSEKMKEDFINIEHNYKNVVSFLYNVMGGRKSKEDIMKELSIEKPSTNI